VVARWVVQENARPGTAAWQIGPGHWGGIEGFANRTYAAAGDAVKLYVSTAARTFHVEAYRVGYYGGWGGRQVWVSAAVRGVEQPRCALASATNMVSCDNWKPSLTVAVTKSFVPGDYLLKLVTNADQQSYVPLTIWDPTSRAAYLVKNDVYTWQAWNPYGGYDFYQGVGACPPNVYPLCSRARVVSFDRPYALDQGAGDFIGDEYPLVRWAEEQGLDVSYATNVTVEEHPGIVMQHRALLSLGHDECWSLHERRAVVAGEAHGLNLVFFAASAILRHVRLQASLLGAHREEVDYRDGTADPLNGKGDPLEVTGNTWGSPPASWPENHFVGAEYAGFLEPDAPPAPFVVSDGSAWIFAHTGLHTGSVLPGALRSDFDQFDSADHPSNEQIFGHSLIPMEHAQSLIGKTQGRVYSDMTYYTDPRSGAGVFDAGDNNWVALLTDCTPGSNWCIAPTVQRITGNLLANFGSGPAGRLRPSNANWRRVYASA
jgi:hypothetical protein